MRETDGDTEAQKPQEYCRADAPGRWRLAVATILIAAPMVVGMALLVGLFQAWPEPGELQRAAVDPSGRELFPLRNVTLLGLRLASLSSEAALLLTATSAGLVGAGIHSLRSVGWHKGRNRLASRWLYFTCTRPLVGAGLAAAAYLAFRAGFMLVGSVGTTYLHGAALIGALAGLFTEQTIQKLLTTFSAIFEEAPDSAVPNAGQTPGQ